MAQQFYRKVRGLKWAKELPGRPRFIPLGKPRGVKALGCRYEARVAAVVQAKFPAARHGVWFEFEDSQGLGVCQPDVLLLLPGRVVVFESKLTWVERADGQVDDLYRPVLEACFGLPVCGVTVCRALTSSTVGRIVGSLAEAVQFSAQERANVVWHHLDAGLPMRARKKERLYG